jgi:hypothetical protein
LTEIYAFGITFTHRQSVLEELVITYQNSGLRKYNMAEEGEATKLAETMEGERRLQER